jgi:very-short-patch-repair endonuclease
VTLTLIGTEKGRSRPGIVVYRARTIDPHDARRRSSLPVTSPARTLLDRAPELELRALERELDEALVRRLTSRTAIRATLARSPGRAGCARLRALIDPARDTTFTRAESEERMLALLRRGGVETPETNVAIGSVEVDFMWRTQRVIVEVDGWGSHGLPSAFERDRRRDAELENDGWRVIRVTWRQLTGEPEYVLVTIATALALRR